MSLHPAVKALDKAIGEQDDSLKRFQDLKAAHNAGELTATDRDHLRKMADVHKASETFIRVYSKELQQ